MFDGCKKKAQGKSCCLESYHDGVHIDAAGFKFIDENWPNHLGNGSNGYPMNNPAFDKAAATVIADRKKDAERAKEFLRKLGNALASKS